MAEKRPKQPKIVKNRSFCVLVNEKPIEYQLIISNRKLVNRKNENKQ